MSNLTNAISKIEKMSKQEYIALLIECGHPDIFEVVKVNDMRHHLKKNGELVCITDCQVIVNHWKKQYKID